MCSLEGLIELVDLVFHLCLIMFQHLNKRAERHVEYLSTKVKNQDTLFDLEVRTYIVKYEYKYIRIQYCKVTYHIKGLLFSYVALLYLRQTLPLSSNCLSSVSSVSCTSCHVH